MLLRRKIVHRRPMELVHVPFLGKLQRAAFRPRRRMAKRFIGKPARVLYRLARASGLQGEGVLSLRTGEATRLISFDARNAQFVTNDDAMSYEPDLAALWDILLEADDVFYDVGANWGYFGLYNLSRPGFTGVVHAFEPYPASYADLERTARQSGFDARFVCHPLALSDHDGRGRMGMVDSVWSGLARMGGASNATEVDVACLDSLQLPLPSAIKIDVEGHEANVLRGAARTLSEARPYVVFENWLEARTPQITLAPFAVLAELKYRFFVPGWVHGDGTSDFIGAAGDARHRPTDVLGLIDMRAEQRFLLPDQVNILAVPEERRDELAAGFDQVRVG